MRLQMRVSEQMDTRIRRAFLRVAVGQEYEAWLRKNLKVLETGLLLHPYMPLNKTDSSAQRLGCIIRGPLEKPIDLANRGESMQALWNAVMSLACRSFDGSSRTCHWADWFPLNIKIYQTLLEVCFDINEETSVIEEVDEVLELIKKTWIILGMNDMLHNLCFSWVLFHQYVATGQVEYDLLFASSNLLAEFEKDADARKDPLYTKTLSSTLSLMLNWQMGH